jgi:hypothetical protein
MHSHRNTLSSVGTVIAFSVLVFSHVVIAQSTTPTPNRLSDKDLETVMSNQKADAKAFRPRFDSAIKKSSIRKTSQAKDAMNLASTFEKQASSALNEFKKTKKGDSFPAMLTTASQIEKIMTDLKIDPQLPVGTRFEPISIKCRMPSESLSPRPQPAVGTAQFPAYKPSA